MNQKTLVWDVPTRMFHWLLVISFTGAFLTSESERYRDVHAMFGYTLLGLIVFRVLWGFIGTRYARFRSFLFTSKELFAYLASLRSGKPHHYVGHNPAGSLAIWLLLLLGFTSSVTGLLLYQEIGGDLLEEPHEFLANTMLAVVGVHLAGVVVSSLIHRENLIRAMITGRKPVEPEAGIKQGHAWLGVVMLVAVVAFWVGYLGSA